MYDKLEPIARITKTHGKRGEVVAEMLRGLPPLIACGMQLACLPPALKGSRWLQVAAVNTADARGVLLSFSGVETMGSAEELVGKTLCLPTSTLPQNFSWLAVEDLLGCTVFDEQGVVFGIVKEVLRSAHQDTLVVVPERVAEQGVVAVVDTHADTSTHPKSEPCADLNTVAHTNSRAEADIHAAAPELLIPLVDAYIAKIDKTGIVCRSSSLARLTADTAKEGE